MAQVENIFKENAELKSKLEDTIKLIKENEVKYQGFKTVQYSLLLCDNLTEVSDKPLKYFEEIFIVERAALFIREGAYMAANGCMVFGERVYVTSNDAFNYTFLENRAFFGANETIIHKDFRIYHRGGKYSFVLVPIIESGVIMGALGFFSKDTERFAAPKNFDFINELANVASIALKKINNTFMLETKAQTDYLTGLPNKSIMEIAAERRIIRCKENKKPFAFLIIDIDNFKTVNDTLGHLTGDDVLKRIARAIRANIGDDDLFGRFGGDEFYLFTDYIDDEKLKTLEKAILRDVSKINDNLEISDRIGVSAGIAVIPEDVPVTRNFTEAVKLADLRLYKAKKKHGNMFSRG